MLWGVTLQPGEDYTAVMAEEVRLSMATIECRASKTTVPCPVSHLAMTTPKGEFLLCSLEKGPTPQQNLDLVLQPREQVTFTIEGTGAVHLTGYTQNKSVVVQDSSSNEDDQEMAYEVGEGSDEPDSARSRKENSSRRIQDEAGGRHGHLGENNTRYVSGAHEETQEPQSEPITTRVESAYPSPANGYGGWLAEEGIDSHRAMQLDDYLQGEVKQEREDISEIKSDTRESFVAKPTPMNYRKQLLSPTQDLVHQAKGVFQKLKEMHHNCQYCFQQFPSLLLCRQHEQIHQSLLSVSAASLSPSGSSLDLERESLGTNRKIGPKKGDLHANRGSRLNTLADRIARNKENNNHTLPTFSIPRRNSYPGFSCKFCDKSFSRQDTCSAHERLHSVEHLMGDAKPCHLDTGIVKQERIASDDGLSMSADGIFSDTNGSMEDTLKTEDADSSAMDAKSSSVDDSSSATELKSGGKAAAGTIHFCEYCRKPFSSRSKLTIHIRKHTGERPYRCRHCSRAFAATGDCRRHEQLHTEEGQNSLPRCRYCAKPFYSISKCLIHERVHTGEKPFQCRMCDNTFSQKGHLVTHERTHSGERPYKCMYCERGFSTSSGRKKHEKLHRKGAKLRPIT